MRESQNQNGFEIPFDQRKRQGIRTPQSTHSLGRNAQTQFPGASPPIGQLAKPTHTAYCEPLSEGGHSLHPHPAQTGLRAREEPMPKDRLCHALHSLDSQAFSDRASKCCNGCHVLQWHCSADLSCNDCTVCKCCNVMPCFALSAIACLSCHCYC